MTDAASLTSEILSGERPELQRMAAEGLLPLPPEELIPVQVALATTSDDPEVRGSAERSLGEMEPRILSRFLDQAAHDDLVYFASRIEHPLVLETLLRRKDIPRPLLAHMASRLPEDLQEILLLRQDAIVEEPTILEALESNPQLSSYARRRIREYREHLLPRTAPRDEPEAPSEEAEEDEEEWTDEQVAAAIEEARKAQAEDAAGDEGEIESLEGLTESQIRMLPVQARLKLARSANRSLRGVLVRDPNPRVAVAVIKYNSVTDPEVEQYARNRSICEDVLEEIGKRREWIRKHPIVLALVQNPKTPVTMTMKFVPRLSVRELRELGRNRNVPDPVRSAARRLYTIKTR